MSVGGLAGIQLFKLSCLSESPQFLGNKTHFPLSESRLGLDSKRVKLVISPPMASVSGSGAEYFEQLLGAKPKQKKERIAGIDQDELLDPTLLADPDSCFCEFKGIQIHHKVCDLESPTQNLLQDPTSSISPSRTNRFSLPMVLLHGFGASVFSWQWVMKPLARVTGSKVLAFDRPAFGLTSRRNPYDHYSSSSSENIKPLNPYSMMFSVLATLHFIDFLAAEKAVLVGHSAGSLVAVNTYFEAPERVAALVLVAPAILAPLIAPKVVKENQSKMDTKTHWHRDDSNLNVQSNPFIRLCDILSKFSKHIVRAIMRLVKGMGEMLNFLYKKALSAVLRSAFAVMLPLRAKGWDKALVEYIAAMLTDSSPNSKPPLVNRFNEISCPVLIVTGDCDRLVPSWNAERLSRVIPGSCLEVIKNCGHLPQEEKAEEFVFHC
ncbi:alpha/beta-Hydrolases superfamily protein [Actinidia rufa]|uniref:Alpha/beta-Hydrolases superfamily protein n=1 Tax=Actinidia rufa TaxID=165716 RepID=A0A7J0EAX3_9ERIC|nr:alpha/beta-Hydrolases superfamily protein [Actinidia rufa]